MSKQRLQKILANAGYASRREIERWIEAGRIELNGKTAKLGDCADEHDKIMVDGRKARLAEHVETRVIMYHKPLDEICTRNDPEGRPTVFDNLPTLKNGRWINIGRLDINTSGLLLFTNDGELANALMHPSNQVEREYAVRILGKVDEKMLKNITRGVKLDDGMARFEHVLDSGGEGANHWYHVVVVEGRNRLVRRLWESQGVTVSRLKRVRFGPVNLTSSVRQGQTRELTGTVLKKILAKVSED